MAVRVTTVAVGCVLILAIAAMQVWRKRKRTLEKQSEEASLTRVFISHFHFVAFVGLMRAPASTGTMETAVRPYDLYDLHYMV